MTPAFKRDVRFLFEVDGEQFATPGSCLHLDGSLCLEVEETRKNGQEDTHMRGVLTLVNGWWSWVEGEESFECPQLVVDFLNGNEVPMAEEV